MSSSRASFHWDDPLLLSEQLTDDERMALLLAVKAKSFEKKDLLTADEFRTIVDRVLQKQSV